MDITIEAVPVLKSIVRTAVAAEFVKNFGADDATVKIVQQAVSEGLISTIIIYGMAPNGYAMDDVALTFDELTEDVRISVDAAEGKSMTEALDVGLAAGMAYAVAMFQRKGLRAQFEYRWSARANTDASLAASARARFGWVDAQPVQRAVSYAPDYAPRQVISIRPARDKGILYTVSTARPVGRRK